MFKQFINYGKKDKPLKKLKYFRIEIGLNDLTKDMENISQDEIRNKRLNALVDFLEDILIAAKADEEIPPLETEEEAEKRQRNQGFKTMDGSYTIPDIQDYFLKIIQKHEPTIETNENSPVLIYPNEVKNRIIFKIKTGYKLELLTNETQKLLGNDPVIDKNKNSKNVPQLDQVDSVLLHCHIIQNITYKTVSYYMNLLQINPLVS